ncbi:MAG: right-handed parallel beta-helix repeat-containing protein [Bacteroidaceae bacterium]|nr:right-handed parallel beta-helix repeat-containing protein [Bacteroidaceae bacterium]
MKTIRLLFVTVLCCAALASCTDDDFTTNTSARLTFGADTIRFDTVFATVPTATRTFWVFNKGDAGIRLTSVRLEGGNQKGFRVNVDGSYLGTSTGFQLNDLEVRKGDSLRVFVELTSPTQTADFTELTDALVFQHESGVEQRVVLTATAWQARILNDYHVSGDETFTAEQPIIVRGNLTINEGATLTLTAGTQLYFNSNAGMHVYGRLVSQGTPDHNVVLRGDRLDRMFDYLPYDGVSGQWRGITIYEGSYDNLLQYTDIHSTMDGISVTSNNPERRTLTMEQSTVHNCQGHGLKSVNADVRVVNCQLTNTLGDCLHVEGGRVVVNNSTLAQFYPFDSARGYALYFDNTTPLIIALHNSIVTGYADDVLQGTQTEENNAFDYGFAHCMLRTPKPEEDKMERFIEVIFEDVDDQDKGGQANFMRIDIDSLRYDFQLSDSTLAINAANVSTAVSIDRMGRQRDEKPDMGCFEKLMPTTDGIRRR